MYDADDDFTFDFDVISSPIANPTVDYGSNPLEFNSNPYYDEQMTTAAQLSFDIPDFWAEKKPVEPITRSKTSPEFLKTNFEAKPSTHIIQTKTQQKKPIVFQPFSSFEAIELTVQALKDHIHQSSKSTLLIW